MSERSHAVHQGRTGEWGMEGWSSGTPAHNSSIFFPGQEVTESVIARSIPELALAEGCSGDMPEIGLSDAG